MRALSCLLLLGCLVLGCDAEETAPPFAPRGRGDGDAGPSSDAGADGGKPTGGSNAMSTAGGGTSDAGTDPGKDAPDGTVQHGGMLVVVEVEDGCALQAVWGGNA